jgi:hypothetical protein
VPLDSTTPAEGFPHGICNAATAYTSSAGIDITVYDDLPGYHLLAARNLITTNDESYHGSDSELPLATSHGYAEWDFSGVPDPVMFRQFLDATDYWFGYSDTSSTEDYDPAHERFTVGIGDVVDGMNVMGAGDGEDTRTRDELRLLPGAYKIKYEDGSVITNAWNIKHMRPFYP